MLALRRLPAGILIALLAAPLVTRGQEAPRRPTRPAERQSEVRSVSKRQNNGFYHRGKYIGFVPAHLKHAGRASRLEGQTPPRVPEQPRLRFAPSTTTVAYETAKPIESVAVPESIPYFSPEVAPSPMCGLWSASPTIWGQADYLLWWTRRMDAPPLATTGPAIAQGGVLGRPDTTVLFGGGLFEDSRSGGRFTLGFWLDDSRCRGFDVTYLRLSDEEEGFAGSSNQFPVLTRPFFNTQVSNQDVRRIAFPGQVQGSLNVLATTEFETVEVLYRRASDCLPCQRVEFLLGYRLARLDELLQMSESTLVLGGGAPGATTNLTDRFASGNEFHGGELGVRLLGDLGSCSSWEFVAKVAVGNTNSRARVTGQATRTAGGISVTTPGGLLTQPTNINNFERDKFSAIWELGVTLRRELQCGWTTRFGYTFLLWQDVSRPSDQLDLAVNQSQIPPGMLAGEPRPSFLFRTSDFWAHGLHFGLEYEY